MHYKLIN